jgi:hypothetical protein
VTNYLRRTNRFDEILFAVAFLALAGFLGYFGLRGASLYFQGSRAAPADPIASAIGITASVALLYLALRLIFHWHGDGPLLPTPVLLICGLGAIGGAIWFAVLEHQLSGSFTGDLQTSLASAGAGVGALALWWRRVRDAQR